jgi:hypothetical protein
MLGTYLSEDEYIEANSGTTDEVDKAVIKYYKKSREIVYPAVSYNYECAKQSLAVSVGENLTQEKASHHPVTVDLRPYW